VGDPIMTKYPSFPVLLLAALLAVGVLLLTDSSAVGQDAPESERAPTLVDSGLH